MMNVTNDYKTAIKDETEITRFQAEFGFVPPNSMEGATINTSTPSIVSITEQLKNGNNSMGAKWAFLEPNRIVLDGTCEFLTEDNTRQIGFITSEICGVDGVFTTPPYITYTLDKPYDLIGISVFFDDLGNEYATNVKVEYFNSSGVLINSITTDNDDVFMVVDLLQIGVKQIKVTINKWNKPSARAKVCQVLTGQIFLFTPQNTYNFDFNEAITPFDTSIKLSEYKITFDSSNGKFNIINPTGFAKFLREKMKISSKIGLETTNGTEWIGTGDFYLKEWDLSQSTDETTFTCVPSMGLSNKEYIAPAMMGLQTVEQACAIIFAGIDETFTIDETLKTIQVNKYIGENVPLINAMGQLAVACGGYWVFERNGNYSLKEWAVKTIPDTTVNYDDMWQKSKISQTPHYTSVNVKYYQSYLTPQNDYAFQDYDNIVAEEIDNGEQQTITSSFIPSAERATAIGILALDFYKQRLMQSVLFRGDMTIQAGDTISLQNDYNSVNALVLDHNINWGTDGLNGKLETLGGGG